MIRNLQKGRKSGAYLIWVESFPRQRVGQMLLKVPSNEYYQPACPSIGRGGHEGSARSGAEVSLMLPSQGSSSYLNQTGPQSVLSSLGWLEEEKTCPCSPGAPVWLGRWPFSFCVRSFRQVDSRKSGGGNSGTGNKPMGVTLELD